MVIIREPKTFQFDFDFPKNVDKNLKHEIDFIIKLDESLAENKIKHFTLQNSSIYYTWKNIGKHHKNNKLKIIAPTWNDEFELADSSYSLSDI